MNGLLVRDFFKEYRELRYTNQGSISLTEIEKNAYRLALTLEVTHLDSPRYSNLKTLPENTHFGYCTLFRGSTVIDSIAIKYPKFRVFDIINQGIWDYHQSTESQQLGASVTQLTVEENNRNLLDLLGEGTYAAIRLFVLLGASDGGFDPEEGWLLEAFPSGQQPATYQEFNQAYRGYPIASPFPDIAKFKADVPCSFLWRLEAWYLVNPAVYIVDSPTDSGDETEGESEYPEPEQGDGDGDGREFPTPSPKDAENDPRDYGDSNEPPPFEGGQCVGVVYQVNYEFGGSVAPAYSVTSVNLPGPIKGIQLGSSSANGNALLTGTLLYGVPEQALNLGGLFVEISSGSPPVTEPNNPRFKILSVVRLDGEPDDCGNPSPLI